MNAIMSPQKINFGKLFQKIYQPSTKDMRVLSLITLDDVTSASKSDKQLSGD